MRVSTYCVTNWLPLQVTRKPGYLGLACLADGCLAEATIGHFPGRFKGKECQRQLLWLQGVSGQPGPVSAGL